LFSIARDYRKGDLRRGESSGGVHPVLRFRLASGQRSAPGVDKKSRAMRAGASPGFRIATVFPNRRQIKKLGRK